MLCFNVTSAHCNQSASMVFVGLGQDKVSCNHIKCRRKAYHSFIDPPSMNLLRDDVYETKTNLVSIEVVKKLEDSIKRQETILSECRRALLDETTKKMRFLSLADKYQKQIAEYQKHTEEKVLFTNMENRIISSIDHVKNRIQSCESMDDRQKTSKSIKYVLHPDRAPEEFKWLFEVLFKETMM